MSKFEAGNWASDPELGVMDTILEQNPRLIKMLEQDITQGKPTSTFGRQDTPSVEQIVRAAIHKEMKGLDYRALEYAQENSRICEQFIKMKELFKKFSKLINGDPIGVNRFIGTWVSVTGKSVETFAFAGYHLNQNHVCEQMC